jgi:hypothetical protein
VAVLRKGKVAAAGTIAELTTGRGAGASYKMVASQVDETVLASLRESGAQIVPVNGHFQLTIRDLPHLNDVIDRVRARGALVKELTPVRSTLEDVFVDLVKTGDAPDRKDEVPN